MNKIWTSRLINRLASFSDENFSGFRGLWSCSFKIGDNKIVIYGMLKNLNGLSKIVGGDIKNKKLCNNEFYSASLELELTYENIKLIEKHSKSFM